MALAEDTPLITELGNVSEYPVKAATKIYEGAAVGLYASDGSARGVTAGDLFLGFAESQVDNSAGLVGALNVRVLQRGKVELAVASVAATDVGAPVFASDDGTFTLVEGSNTFVGVVNRFVSSGVAVVEFDAVIEQGIGNLGS
jgi:hypothetical protein